MLRGQADPSHSPQILGWGPRGRTTVYNQFNGFPDDTANKE